MGRFFGLAFWFGLVWRSKIGDLIQTIQNISTNEYSSARRIAAYGPALFAQGERLRTPKTPLPLVWFGLIHGFLRIVWSKSTIQGHFGAFFGLKSKLTY
jgi:hypothetical protein